jgi:hypothetical protein
MIARGRRAISWRWGLGEKDGQDHCAGRTGVAVPAGAAGGSKGPGAGSVPGSGVSYVILCTPRIITLP